MTDRIAVSLTIAGLSRIYGTDLRGILETARIADQAGIDQLAMTDHVAIGPRTDRYPYGQFPFPNEEPWPEPLTTLAAIAGATTRIRLATGILVAPLRPAVLLAKTLATLDVFCSGRLDLGVGTGWQAEEFAASGVPFEARAARLDDTLRACRVLWSEAPASFESATLSFENVWSLPQPVQERGIPICFGLALNRRNVARMIEFDAGWMPMTSDLEELADGVAWLRRARSEAGLDPDELRVRANAPVFSAPAGGVDLDRTLESAQELKAIGVTVAAFALPRFVSRRRDIPAFLERLGRLGR
jgi:probable F420-dependent oxidoreductase